MSQLGVRIKEKTGMGIIVVGVCYRLPDQEEQVHEAFYRQLKVASCLQVLVFMGYFNHPDVCWRDNAAGHKQPRRFPEGIGDNFLTYVIEELRRSCALLALVLTNKEGFTASTD